MGQVLWRLKNHIKIHIEWKRWPHGKQRTLDELCRGSKQITLRSIVCQYLYTYIVRQLRGRSYQMRQVVDQGKRHSPFCVPSFQTRNIAGGEMRFRFSTWKEPHASESPCVVRDLESLFRSLLTKRRNNNNWSQAAARCIGVALTTSGVVLSSIRPLNCRRPVRQR
jgi:hypothetical protein